MTENKIGSKNKGKKTNQFIGNWLEKNHK